MQQEHARLIVILLGSWPFAGQYFDPATDWFFALLLRGAYNPDINIPNQFNFAVDSSTWDEVIFFHPRPIECHMYPYDVLPTINIWDAVPLARLVGLSEGPMACYFQPLPDALHSGSYQIDTPRYQ